MPEHLVSSWTQKLAPPRATLLVVERGDAAGLERLCAEAGLVLVHAPAGFGKTSFLRGLHDDRKSSGHLVAWLTVDPADNDPQRFVSYLDAAIRRSVGGALSPGAPAAAATLDGVLTAISNLAGERRFSLFLDDFEVIDNDSVMSIVRDLTRMMAGVGTLFVGSRRLPDLPIGRLRSQGAAVVVGPEDLRLSRDEAAQLLANVLGKRLSPDMVTRLHRRTEGWAAALQLAGLALRKKLDPEPYVSDLSGTSIELDNYLAEEILAAQPEDIRMLLLKTSILDVVCADLSDEICGATNSAELLRRIENDHLFLYPLDERREWFRFHKLFTEFLLRELHQQADPLVPQLHRSAAEWYARHDHKSLAVNHAILSGDLDYAAALANEYAAPFGVSGRLATVVRWGKQLPAQCVDAYPRLKAFYAMSLTGTFDFERATPLIEELSSSASMATLDAETRGVVLFTMPFALLLQDRLPETIAGCETNIPRLDPDDAQARAALMNVRNLCLLHLHRYKDIENTESHVRALATGVTSYALVVAECVSGMSELAQGRLSNATAIYRSGLQTSIRDSSDHSAPTALAAACLAEALYESDEFDELEHVLSRHWATITNVGIPDAIIRANIPHIRRLYSQIGYSAACSALNDLKRLGFDRNLPRVVSTASAEHSRMALLEGDVTSAKRYLQSAEEDAPYATLWDESSVTLHARVLVATGRSLDAMDLIQGELEKVNSTTRSRYALKLRIVLSVALKGAAKDTEAMRVIEQCLRAASSQPFVHIFVDEGPLMAALLREFLATWEADAPSRACAERLLASNWVPVAQEREQGDPQQRLSRRELEVLHLLADGLANKDIAAKLGLSLPTVKTHVANILTKLGAKNRTEAVATARRSQLLS